MYTFFILGHCFITENVALGERKVEHDPEPTPFSSLSSGQHDTNGGLSIVGFHCLGPGGNAPAVITLAIFTFVPGSLWLQ